MTPEPGKLDSICLTGSLTLYGACEFPENASIEVDPKSEFHFMERRQARNEAPPWMRDAVEKHGHLMVLHSPNGFVQYGLDLALWRLFDALTGTAPAGIKSMIVARSSANVASTDTSILGGATAPVFTGTTQNALSKLLTTPTPVAPVASSITGGITFTEVDLNATARTAAGAFWPMNRMGFTNAAPSTNLGVVDIIGNNTGQADPYSRTPSVNYADSGSFTLNPTITIVGIRRVADFPVL